MPSFRACAFPSKVFVEHLREKLEWAVNWTTFRGVYTTDTYLVIIPLTWRGPFLTSQLIHACTFLLDLCSHRRYLEKVGATYLKEFGKLDDPLTVSLRAVQQLDKYWRACCDLAVWATYTRIFLDGSCPSHLSQEFMAAWQVDTFHFRDALHDAGRSERESPFRFVYKALQLPLY